MDMTLTQDEYTALVTLARRGADDPVILEQALLRPIERRNGIIRYYLMVQWQDAAGVVPIGTEFPGNWPANLRAAIEQVDTPINRQQVEQMVALRANKPVSILVTSDPNGQVGWSELDQWFAPRT